MRRPIHQLRQYWYNDLDGTMNGDRIHHLDTYQQEPVQVEAPAGTPPVVVNVNLAGILDGLGLGDLIKAILDRAPRPGVTERLQEGVLPKVPRRRLIEAITRGADPREVADLMAYLSGVGGLE